MSESPVTVLYYALTLNEKKMPPFDFMIEWMGEPTIARAWAAEADADFPTPGYMIRILRTVGATADVPRAAAAAVAATSRTPLLTRIAEAMVRGEPIAADVRTGLRRSLDKTGYAAAVGHALLALRHRTTERATGDFMVALFKGMTGEPRVRAGRDAARAIARVVPAPTVTSIMRALEKR